MDRENGDMSYYLQNFQKKRPPFETSQEKTLDWLIQAHSYVEKDSSTLKEEIREKFFHVGCKSNHISKRGHIIDDYAHLDWSKMKVYSLDQYPTGVGLEKRLIIYNEYVKKLFEEFYPEDHTAPDEIIHVTCTGYVSPSGAQQVVSKNHWGDRTTVTHAYHMGCYASIPAVRMACGDLALQKKQVDIVHTEICSLHVNPMNHDLDQLVAQSLFADGFIRYTLTKQKPKHGLKLINTEEQIIPNSLHSMTWNLSDWGFKMSLAKDIPVRIARSLKTYLQKLYPKDFQNALFAVHPGGPKILDQIQQWLGIEKQALRFSYDILYQYGNMSSATLPHIWQKIIEDDSVPSNTPIISLAFGPGLSICGAWMEKI